jgi:Rhodopirellula transposase DDE domain
VIDPLAIKARFEALAPFLDERGRRLFAASEARAAGRGGVTAVSDATGIARSTIGRGLIDLRTGAQQFGNRVRRVGGGGKSAIETQPGLLAALNELVQSSIRGDPEAALLWVSKSQRHLATALAKKGFTAGQKLVGRLLRRLGFSLQANSKTREGTSHPDRNDQFEHINAQVAAFQAAGEPAISVDTKKKELVGDFKNGGRELRPKSQPEPVRVHDFVIPELGKVVPYGVYDIAANTGWVSLGITHDTAAFAVESIRRWWHECGSVRYPTATRLLITADCGGSNGVRVRLWKRELQVLADELGITITVCHLPPGTSKWNRIEHRLFAFITQNWRGKPLLTHQVVIQLIASTTTTTGLTVACRLDASPYEKAIRVSDTEMAELNITLANFHGDWNYSFTPRS